ncbi:MAG: serine protease [Burkholderiales bacterium]|nr:serine protease [Burkholderiales bacterium]
MSAYGEDAASNQLSDGATATVAWLSGERRGRTERLGDAAVRIEAAASGAFTIASATASGGDAGVATLQRVRGGCRLDARSKRRVWVDGVAVRAHLLRGGEVVEIENGPVFRFRLYPPGAEAAKSLGDVFTDCVDCARRDGRALWVKAPGLVRDVVRDLATQTSRWFRLGVLAAIAALAAATVYQFQHARDLEQRLAREQGRIQALGELLGRSGTEGLARGRPPTAAADTERRLSALEARSVALGNIIAAVSPSVVFIQGGFGFEDPASGRPLRMVLGPDGLPIEIPGGGPAVTLNGDGPVVEVNFTGTAFVVSTDGLLVTNRHVAMPWEHDPSVELVKALGLRPVMRRLVGYLADAGEPFELGLVGASDAADLALLSCQDVARLRTPLKLASAAPRPGDEVVVLGYPTGIRALLARAGERFVKALGERPDADFWGVAQALARSGLIRPLATRGIVGQVTGEAVVYDAETTSGGSGGPVLNLAGEVIAVNMAVIPRFGGSNIGVPVEHVRDLLNRPGVPGSR